MMALLKTLDILRTLDINSMFSLQYLGMLTETYLDPCQTFKMHLLEKIVNDFSLSTIFAKNFILDVCHGSECAFGIC